MGARFSKSSLSKTELHVAVNGNNLPGLTFNECLRHHADVKPNSDAFVFVSTDGSRETITWGALLASARKMADFLIGSGVRRDEFVAISMGNCPEWLYVVFGSFLAGIPVVSLAFTYKDGSDAMATMEKLKTCSFLFLGPDSAGLNWNIMDSLTEKVKIDGTVQNSKLTGLKKIIFRQQPTGMSEHKTIKRILTSQDIPAQVLPEVNENDTTYLFQTSGSTGVPKLAVHTHRSAMVYKRFVQEVYPEDDVMFNDRPFTWIGGFQFTATTGQTRVTTSCTYTSPGQRLEFFIDVVQKERCTSAIMLPPTIIQLMTMKEKLKSNWPLRMIITGGMPVTKAFTKCVGSLCKYLAVVYACTEATILTSLVLKNASEFEDFSCGTQLQLGSIKIVDEHGEVAPVNQRGEIYVNTEGLFSGYFNDVEKTRRVMDGGWYKTDDLGRMDEYGNVKVEGRKSDMILTGTITLAPSILEAAIKSCPGVDHVAVVGVPDDIMYQLVCACVIVKPGSGLDEAGLRSYCERVHNKNTDVFEALPRFYMIMDKFPETHTGKVSKTELTKMATQRFAPTK